MKTVISANIPVSLANQLKSKTKGTRSRVIERALKAYLEEKEAFNIEEVSTADLLMEIAFRKELTQGQREMMKVIWREVKE